MAKRLGLEGRQQAQQVGRPRGLTRDFARDKGYLFRVRQREDGQMGEGSESRPETMLRGYRDLKVYQLAYKLAMEVIQLCGTFPEDERYSLTSQIRRSSRSVAANIAEGFRKRQYAGMFVSKLADSDAEATETQVWLDFAPDCRYLSEEQRQQLVAGYEELGKMLRAMMERPERFKPS